jgi:hypothetical protein
MKLVAIALVLGFAGVAHADAPQQKRPLRQFLLQKFDRNHDGKLQPRERKQAAKVLHKLAKRLAKADAKAGHRGQRRQKFIDRFDMNQDGNIGPGEMPPALADELRPLDRDGDGWLQGDELP